MSCDFTTPAEAPITKQPLIKRWKNSRKRSSQTKEQTESHQNKEINLPS